MCTHVFPFQKNMKFCVSLHRPVIFIHRAKTENTAFCLMTIDRRIVLQLSMLCKFSLFYFFTVSQVLLATEEFAFSNDIIAANGIHYIDAENLMTECDLSVICETSSDNRANTHDFKKPKFFALRKVLSRLLKLKV